MKKPKIVPKTLNAYGAKTKYVAKLMKKTRWKNHKHIDVLLKFEDFVLSGYKKISCDDYVLVTYFIPLYEKDFKQILKEVRPYDSYPGIKKKEKTAHRAAETEQERALKKIWLEAFEAERKAKKDWLAAGGKR